MIVCSFSIVKAAATAAMDREIDSVVHYDRLDLPTRKGV